MHFYNLIINRFMAHHMGKGRLQEANYCYKV